MRATAFACSVTIMLAGCGSGLSWLTGIPQHYRTPSRDIYVVNADGTAVARVMALPVDGGNAVWSPDRRKIAYTAEGMVFVADADGTDRLELTERSYLACSRPVWSPDGMRVAFHCHGPGPNQTHWAHVARSDGSELSVLAESPSWLYDLAWSPDGRRVVFGIDHQGIWVANADGTGRRQLAADGYGPSWSPDGSRLAFVAGGGGTQDVFVAYVDDRRRIQLTHDGLLKSAWWSPTAEEIAVAIWRPGTVEEQSGVIKDLYIVGADGGDRRRLPAEMTWPGPIVWSPDGRRMAFLSMPPRPSAEEVPAIEIVDRDGNGRASVPRYDLANVDPTWSVDGEQLYFLVWTAPKVWRYGGGFTPPRD